MELLENSQNVSEGQLILLDKIKNSTPETKLNYGFQIMDSVHLTYQVILSTH